MKFGPIMFLLLLVLFYSLHSTCQGNTIQIYLGSNIVHGTVSAMDIKYSSDDWENSLVCEVFTSRFRPNSRFQWRMKLSRSWTYTFNIPNHNGSSNHLGWSVYKRLGIISKKLALLRNHNATEGYFICEHENLPFKRVAIYYPISSVRGEIKVVSGREGTFRVRCTSTGGKTLTMSVSGPQYSSDEMTVESVGTILGLGNDSYTAITNIISGGDDGNVYNCTASNGLPNEPINSVTLKVASDPVIMRMTQTSETSVRVEWSQPSGGSTVTGYVVHYSDGISERNESVPASSTTFEILDLSPGIIYNFSVEATSDQLSGESPLCRLCSPNVTTDTFSCSEGSNNLAICTKTTVRGEIEVASGREGTFRVRCTLTGGKTLTMSVSGPQYSSEDRDNTLTITRCENITYSVITNTMLGGDDGDVYSCRLSSGLRTELIGSVVLKVASEPVITRMTQTSETSVRVEWSQPSGGSTVTGYVVHYSDGISERNESVPASSTTVEVLDLSPGIIYNFSVEATSEHLSGESTPCTLYSNEVTCVPSSFYDESFTSSISRSATLKQTVTLSNNTSLKYSIVPSVHSNVFPSPKLSSSVRSTPIALSNPNTPAMSYITVSDKLLPSPEFTSNSDTTHSSISLSHLNNTLLSTSSNAIVFVSPTHDMLSITPSSPSAFLSTTGGSRVASSLTFLSLTKASISLSLTSTSSSYMYSISPHDKSSVIPKLRPSATFLPTQSLDTSSPLPTLSSGESSGEFSSKSSGDMSSESSGESFVKSPGGYSSRYSTSKLENDLTLGSMIPFVYPTSVHSQISISHTDTVSSHGSSLNTITPLFSVQSSSLFYSNPLHPVHTTTLEYNTPMMYQTIMLPITVLPTSILYLSDVTYTAPSASPFLTSIYVPTFSSTNGIISSKELTATTEPSSSLGLTLVNSTQTLSRLVDSTQTLSESVTILTTSLSDYSPVTLVKISPTRSDQLMETETLGLVQSSPSSMLTELPISSSSLSTTPFSTSQTLTPTSSVQPKETSFEVPDNGEEPTFAVNNALDLISRLTYSRPETNVYGGTIAASLFIIVVVVGIAIVLSWIVYKRFVVVGEMDSERPPVAWPHELCADNNTTTSLPTTTAKEV